MSKTPRKPRKKSPQTRLRDAVDSVSNAAAVEARLAPEKRTSERVPGSVAAYMIVQPPEDRPALISGVVVYCSAEKAAEIGHLVRRFERVLDRAEALASPWRRIGRGAVVALVLLAIAAAAVALWPIVSVALR